MNLWPSCLLFVCYGYQNIVCFRYKFIKVIWFCSNWLAMSNSCYNPFIYSLLNVRTTPMIYLYQYAVCLVLGEYALFFIYVIWTTGFRRFTATWLDTLLQNYFVVSVVFWTSGITDYMLFRFLRHHGLYVVYIWK